MQGWKVRLALALTMLAMLIAVSVPSMAQDFGDECFILDADGNYVEIDCEDIIFFDGDCFIEDENGDFVEIDCDDIWIATSFEDFADVDEDEGRWGDVPDGAWADGPWNAPPDRDGDRFSGINNDVGDRFGSNDVGDRFDGFGDGDDDD
jgi:hypothetical protein